MLKQSTMEEFRLFDEKPNTGINLSFLDSSEKPFSPPPPCIEVFEVTSSAGYAVETVNFDGFSLLKGRVNTKEVFAFSNLDLVPGKYEGGLKLWECSLDLVKTLQAEKQDGKLSLSGKRVLELGCGHGLPGIFCCLEGANVVHFQDFNSEVLQCLTMPNVATNIQKSLPSGKDMSEGNPGVETRFFAGDWSEVHTILPHSRRGESEEISDQVNGQDDGYDIILMAETVYSVYALPSLYKLIKKCLRSPHGAVYMAAKKHYFGVGGGSRRFLSIVEKDSTLTAELVAEVADGSSNVREVWKLHLK